jgi:hypothetical protein
MSQSSQSPESPFVSRLRTKHNIHCGLVGLLLLNQEWHPRSDAATLASGESAADRRSKFQPPEGRIKFPHLVRHGDHSR